MESKTVLTPSQKMKNYRAQMRRAGLRPLQIWVPDVRSPNMAEQFRRQSLVARDVAEEAEVLDFFEAASDWDDVS